MIHDFLQRRSIQKFTRNKMGMAALGIILIYVGIGLSVALFGMVSIEETSERVAPGSIPGFFGSQSLEKRSEDAEFYLGKIDKALKSSSPASALKEISLAEKKVVKLPLEELKIRLSTAWDLFDDIAEIDFDHYSEANLSAMVTLENRVDALYTVNGNLGYWLRTSLGTDRQGRSILLRSIYSIRVAIMIGLITAIISVVFGSFVGAAAGYFGGPIDLAVIWLYSTFSSIPNLVLLTVLAYMFAGTVFDGTLIPVYVAFCTTFWIGPCRVIRGETLKLKEMEYVQAATSMGFKRFYILLKHILPNTAHLMFINFSLLFIGAIKSEVILTFLGLGVKKGASWGLMIRASGQEVVRGHFWQIGAATFFMFGLVLAFNILSDALQDAFDPKHVS